MKLLDVVREVRHHLEENGRVSLRMLRRQYELDEESLDELIEELVDVQRVARREENVLVWAAEAAAAGPRSQGPGPRSQSAERGDRLDTRKVVTILFADLAGSTALHERLDPESVRRFMEMYYGAMRAAVELHGGTVVKLLGDGVMVAFGVPTVAEDDALRAVRAGLAMQLAFRDLVGGVGRADVVPAVAGPPGHETAAQIGLRVAINTGEVIVTPDNTDVLGDPVNVAARLQQEAGNGDVVLGESTQRLVSSLVTLTPLGSVTLKGRAEAVKAYRVESLERPAGVIAAPFVGRAAELARLETAYAAAVEKPATGLAVLLGSPGLGKSRLIDELKRRLGDTTTVLSAYCNAAGGATFAPIAAALREVLTALPAADGGETNAGVDPLRLALEAVLPAGADRDRIIAGITALLAGSPASPEETFFVVRRMLAALAQTKPVVLVIDDLQWAEPLLLDLVEHLVQWGGGVPLLVLVGARPELRDVRSSLVTPGGFVGDVLTLAGLDAGAAMRLAANVIGAEDLPAAVAAKVLATSEGNPLFVGELVRMLVQEGALTKEGDRWIPGVALAALEMPPTIHALLAARIERLRPEERSVLERAAVVGRHFSRNAVAELMSRDVVDLDARLEALRRSELIEPDTGWFLGEPVLRFHHVLIRDAAYRRLLKGTRAELHGRFADWVTARGGEAADHDETIGWHLEQAHQLLRELGPLDAFGRSLGERAAQHLAAAGRRALGRDDLPVAADLLGRAIDRLDTGDAARAELALDWCEALLSAGDVSRAAGAISELERFAEMKGLGAGDWGLAGEQTDGTRSSSPASPQPLAPSPLSSGPRAEAAQNGRLRAWATCFAAQLTVLTAPQGLQTAADNVAAAAQQLAALGDAGGEAKAHSVHATALARLGKVGACEAALDQALAAARRGGDRRRANAVLAGAPLAALWGPSPVTRASGRCLDVVRVLRITQGAPAVESVALSCQGVLEALRGRTEAARRMLASSRKMVEDLGIAHRLFEADAFAGRISAMEGDDATAERLLRGAYVGLRDLGLGIDAARAGALLGRALLAQDRSAEAEAISYESEALAGDDLQASIAWRGVRAEALAQRGEHMAAIELAKAAVAIASATDALLDHADARVALTVALRAAGRGAEADAEERRAIELWEAKGATLLAERARQSPTAARPESDHVARRAGDGPPYRGPEAQKSRGAPAAARATAGPRIRANAASRNAARLTAALTATDLDAAERELGDSVHVVHHPTGITYDRPALLESFRRTVQTTKGLAVRSEALATLGDRLCLSRQWISFASADDAGLSTGAAEIETLMLGEVDATGRRSGTEIFAADHLAEAITRLYARHAELLPAGPERARAAATARLIDVNLMSPDDVDGVATVIAPDFESIDHRPLSTWSMRGGSAFLEHLRALRAVAADVVILVQDILALGPTALLTRRLHAGTERLGGGAYERSFLVLFATDTAGRLARMEWFADDHEAEAMARFAEIVEDGGPGTAGPTTPRRVRPNVATAMQDRFDRALAARDFTAVATVFAASHQEIDHPTGSTYGRDACISSLQRLFRSREPHYDVERLATLGELLLLVRRRSGASGAATANYDVGAYENETIQLFEVNQAGLCCRSEVFAGDRLGDAIARLYQRYAELLPDGEQRTRAAAVAQLASVSMTAHAPDHVERLAALLAPDFEGLDHRHLSTWSTHGAAAYVEHLRALRQVGDNIVFRHDEILALTPAAFLNRVMHSGTERLGGGAYERAFLSLFATDAEGRFSRAEWFDEDREAEALARFAAIVGERGGPGTARPTQHRRVRPNAATRQLEREWAAIEARDVDALLALNAGAQVIHHPTGATYGASGIVDLYRGLWRGANLKTSQEILATLGDSLALMRRVASHDGVEAKFGSVGPVEVEILGVVEVDDLHQTKHSEVFAADRLGDALARLYERYAEILPEGPQRSHAAAVARFTAVQMSASPVEDLEDRRAVLAPDFEGIDHRHLSTWSIKGVESYLQHLRALGQVGDDIVFRQSEILALEPSAYLCRVLHSGTERIGGGAYERAFLCISAADAAGRLARMEWFADDREVEALARFERIVSRGGPETARPTQGRHLRSSAATRGIERFQALIAARDGAALAEVFAESLDVLHHPTRATYGRREMLGTWRSIVKAERLEFRSEILASLGDTLALERHFLSIEGLRESHLDGFGRSEFDEVALIETDERGRWAHVEIFAADRLRTATVRLYERYAESLPESAARTRAGGAARSIAAFDGTLDADRIALAHVSSFECVDHRILGTWSARGRDEYLTHWRGQGDLATGWAARDDEVLALDPAAIVVRMTFFGTSRASGGAFENVLLSVSAFGADGLITRTDVFESDREAEALACFEQNAGGGVETERELFANAASRADRELFRCFNGRNWEGVLACVAPVMVFDERRRLVRNTCGRDIWLEQFRLLYDVPNSRFTSRLRATRGEHLALNFQRFEGEVAEGGGPLALDDHFVLHEVDGDGFIVGIVLFDLEDEAAAHAELDARFAAGEGALHPRASAWVREFQRAFAARDWAAMAALHGPDQIAVNHRTVGWGTLRGPGAWVTTMEALVQLAADAQFRLDHLRTCERGILWQSAWQGTRDGGPFETPLFVATELDDRGLQIRMDVWDADVFEPARARFAEMSAGGAATQPEPFANDASRTDAELFRCFNGRDWEGVLACVAPVMVFDERRRLARNTCGRDVWLEQFRFLYDVPNSRFTSSLRATRGERLALNVHRFEGEVAEGGGPLAVDDHFVLHEVDADGLIVGIVIFDLEDEDAAYAELDLRFESGEGAAHAAHGLSMRAFMHSVITRDWSTVLAHCSPDFIEYDHRSLAVLGTTRGAAAWVQNFSALIDLAPDTIFRSYHLRSAERAFLSVCAWVGSRDGGRYEIPLVSILELDRHGRPVRCDIYDPDQFDQARKRFAELSMVRDADSLPEPFANLASRAERNLMRSFAARDWAGVEACAAPELVFDDRQPLRRLTADRQEWRTLLRVLFDVPSARFETRLLATRGERLSLHANRFAGEVAGGGGPLQLDDHLALYEVDRDGRIVAVVLFAEGDEDAAHAELERRFEAGEGVSIAKIPSRFTAGITKRDWVALTALCSPELVEHDHRPLIGLEPTRGAEAWVQKNLRVYIELAPDTAFRFFHIRTNEGGWFTQYAWVGTREGGPYEIAQLAVVEQDDADRSRMLRIDVYDLAQLTLARARFAEVGAQRPATVGPHAAALFANAATRAVERGTAALAARDWDAFAALMAPQLRHYDRTRVAQLETDGAEWLASFRQFVEMTAEQPEYELLATRGERLALFNMLWRGAGGDVGPSEIDWRLIVEVNDREEHIAIATYDSDRLDAAYAELEARFEAGEGVSTAGIPSRFTAGLSRRDWAALTALCSPDLVEYDHRPVIGLEPTRGAEAWVQNNLRVYIELAPDTVFRTFHVRPCEGGWLVHFAWEGTREGGRYEISQLAVIEQDEGDRSRMRRIDVYDLAQLDLARARFAELAAPPVREPFANAATRLMARGCAAWAARDWRQMACLLAADFRNYDRTSMAQIESDREQWLASFRDIIELTASMVPQTLATRGERLALHRVPWRGEGVDVGPSEIDWLALIEANGAGELAAIVTLGPYDVDAAYAELDARFEAGEALAHPRASKWLADYLLFFAARDWNAMTTLFAADLVGENHRLVGWGTLHGPAAIVSTMQAQIELAPDTQERVDHVRTCAGAVLFEYAWYGTYAGGAFENLWTVLVELDADGRGRRADVWEHEQLPRALARFAEIAAPDAATGPFENAASRAWREVSAALQQRDVERFAALHPPAFRYRDHRRLVQLDLDHDGYLAFARPLLEMRSTGAALDLLATRGERLALVRPTLAIADAAAGPSAVESLLLIEVGEHGAMVAYDRYELDDQKAASAEIEARWQTGEGAAHIHAAAWDAGFDAAAERRDWDAAATFFAPAFVAHDHRLVSWGALHGSAGFLVAVQTLAELAPDVRARTQHLRASSRGSLADKAWSGTRDGGAFESPFIGVVELDGSGRAVRMDVYDPHHLEQALARFAEIRAGEAPAPPVASDASNAATAAIERMWAFDVGEPDVALEAVNAARALFAPDFVWEDRRPMMGLSGDLDLMLASLRERVAAGARQERRTIVGTAGERVVVARVLWAGGPPDGRFEVEFLALHEVNEAGLHSAILFFDVDDEDAAKREAWARWAAIDPVAAPWVELLTGLSDAWNGRHQAQLRARFADDLVVEDHRHAGLGRIEGANAYVGSNVVLWQLAPDQRLEIGWSWPAVAPHGFVGTLRRVGTLADGGAFESEYLCLGLARGGRFTRTEFFEIDALDRALARFAELRPDPLRIPPNAATRTVERVAAHAAAGEWDALRILSAAMAYEDRRPFAQVSGGGDEFVASLRFVFESGFRPSMTVLATAGDRLALQRNVCTLREEGHVSEVEVLELFEVDANGGVVASLVFDPPDRAAAEAELFERYIASDGDGMPRGMTDYFRGVNGGDLARARTGLCDDFVLEDHRRTGMGRLEGGDAYIASVAAYDELTGELHIHPLYTAAIAPHGRVVMIRVAGTNAEGGAFESYCAALVLYRDERIASFEFFEPEELDSALARLAERGAGPAGSKPD